MAEIYALIDKDLKQLRNCCRFPGSTAPPVRTPSRPPDQRSRQCAVGIQTYRIAALGAKVLGLCNTVIASGQYSLLPNFVDVWKDGLNGAGKNSSLNPSENAGLPRTRFARLWFVLWRIAERTPGWASNQWNLGWGWKHRPTNWKPTGITQIPGKPQPFLYSGQFDGGEAQGWLWRHSPALQPGNGPDQKYWNKKVYLIPRCASTPVRPLQAIRPGSNHRVIPLC